MTDDCKRPICSTCAARRSALYDVGEPIDFLVTAPATSTVTLPYVLTWDGAEVIRRGRIALTDGEAIISVLPDRPGVVRLTIETDSVMETAAAVAPEQIAPSLPPPDDFDDVWTERLATQGDTPLHSEMGRPAEGAYGTTLAVTISTPNADTIYGWLHRPRGDGPFPAIVKYHGAGVYGLPLEQGTKWAERGALMLSINAHSIQNDQPAQYYAHLRNGELADYRQRPEVFVGMFQRAAAAVDFVASLPEWDERHLIVKGHSQGGGQAIAAAALNERVTALVATCPTHCDHTAKPPGWPGLLRQESTLEQVHEARLLDGTNFATKITCPALFGICLLDQLCAPTGVFAAYNALRGPKSLHCEPATGHTYTDAVEEVESEWIEGILGRGDGS